VVVRPRLTAYTGSGLYLVYTVRAVVSGGRVVYRIRGSANEAITRLSVDAAGVDITDHRIVGDGSHFEIDLLEDHVLALASRAGTLTMQATLASGATALKGASLILAVSKLGLTASDPTEVWPPATCRSATRACILAVPPGTTDLGACGDAVDVLPCLGSVGVVVDDVAIVDALAAVDARLADPEVRADGHALVGPERVEAWLEGARLTAEARLEDELGRVYPDLAGRDQALSSARESAIDLASAEPLSLVEPLSPLPGDAARAREVAADALLAHLATRDFASSELGRPLTELARVFRARHVASIDAFRRSIDPTPGLTPNSDAYVGDWIGLYTEVELDRTTQQAVRILVEID
jgi:hypothetical protein